MSGTNKDTINYFPIYMRHCTVFQPNKDEDKVESADAVVWFMTVIPTRFLCFLRSRFYIPKRTLCVAVEK